MNRPKTARSDPREPSPRFGGAFFVAIKNACRTSAGGGTAADYVVTVDELADKTSEPTAFTRRSNIITASTCAVNGIRALLRFYYDYSNVPKRTYMPLLATSPPTRYSRMQSENARKTRKNHPFRGGFRLVRPVRFERMAFRVGDKAPECIKCGFPQKFHA